MANKKKQSRKTHDQVIAKALNSCFPWLDWLALEVILKEGEANYGWPVVKMNILDLSEASWVYITYASGYGFREIRLEYC